MAANARSADSGTRIASGCLLDRLIEFVGEPGIGGAVLLEGSLRHWKLAEWKRHGADDHCDAAKPLPGCGPEATALRKYGIPCNESSPSSMAVTSLKPCEGGRVGVRVVWKLRPDGASQRPFVQAQRSPPAWGGVRRDDRALRRQPWPNGCAAEQRASEPLSCCCNGRAERFLALAARARVAAGVVLSQDGTVMSCFETKPARELTVVGFLRRREGTCQERVADDRLTHLCARL